MTPLDPNTLDEILGALPLTGHMTLFNRSEKERQLRKMTDHIHVLKAYDYVKIREYEGQNDISSIGLTPMGVIFVSRGGFAEQERLSQIERSDLQLQRENWITTTATSHQAIILSKWSLSISLLAVIASLVTLLI